MSYSVYSDRINRRRRDPFRYIVRVKDLSGGVSYASNDLFITESPWGAITGLNSAARYEASKAKSAAKRLLDFGFSEVKIIDLRK